MLVGSSSVLGVWLVSDEMAQLSLLFLKCVRCLLDSDLKQPWSIEAVVAPGLGLVGRHLRPIVDRRISTSKSHMVFQPNPAFLQAMQ